METAFPIPPCLPRKTLRPCRGPLDEATGRRSWAFHLPREVTMNPDKLIQVLQVSVSPVVLISGVGLLLLSMTNRLGRATDKTRALAKERAVAIGQDRDRLDAQLRIIYTRAGMIQRAIIGATLSILLVGLTVLSLFAKFAFGLPLSELIYALFGAAIASLVFALIMFLQDVSLSLRALHLEVEETIQGPKS